MLGSSVAAVLLFALTAFADSSASTCYYRRQDQILVKKDWQVCGNTATGSNGASLCCRNGDLCGEDSLCRSTNVQEGNEWYVGGCTNKDYKGTICNKACSKSSKLARRRNLLISLRSLICSDLGRLQQHWTRILGLLWRQRLR